MVRLHGAIVENIGPERMARQGWILDLVFTEVCGNDVVEQGFHKLKSNLRQLKKGQSVRFLFSHYSWPSVPAPCFTIKGIMNI
jgi:hypothetical protein